MSSYIINEKEIVKDVNKNILKPLKSKLKLYLDRKESNGDIVFRLHIDFFREIFISPTGYLSIPTDVNYLSHEELNILNIVSNQIRNTAEFKNTYVDPDVQKYAMDIMDDKINYQVKKIRKKFYDSGWKEI